MRRTLMILSALALATVSVGGAQAQKLDANGRCHGPNGQFAKAEVCGGAMKAAPSKMTAAKPAMTAAPAAVAPPVREKESAKCKNDKGKFAKCGSPGAHPA